MEAFTTSNLAVYGMTDYGLPTNLWTTTDDNAFMMEMDAYRLPTTMNLSTTTDDNASLMDAFKSSNPMSYLAPTPSASSASTSTVAHDPAKALAQSQPSVYLFNQEDLQQRLQALIEGARESWTYAIFWQSHGSDCAGRSLLGWGDGYYQGEDNEGKRKTAGTSAAEQEYRKKVLRELNSLIRGSQASPDDADVEEVTDTEWFFLVSITQSFANGNGLPGQAFFNSAPVWVAGAERLAGSPCERARQAQSFGLQTVVCIPLTTGVIELGWTDVIYQSGDLMNKVRVLFNLNVIVKGLKVASAKENNAAAVPSSGPKKCRRAEETERVFIVKGIRITRKNLRDRKHMKRQEAAKDLKICLTSLQAACRRLGYPRWPPMETDYNASSTCDEENMNEEEEEEEVVTKKRKKVNNDNPSSSACDPKHVKGGIGKKMKKVSPSCSTSNRPRACAIGTTVDVHAIHSVPPQNDAGSVSIKVTYIDDTARLLLPFSSTKAYLMEEVTQSLPSLNQVSFNIKYQDEENEWISINRDADLSECFRIWRSLGNKSAPIKMKVVRTSNQAP